MAFRSDLDAAHHRVDALERQIVALEKRNEEQEGDETTALAIRRFGGPIPIAVLCASLGVFNSAVFLNIVPAPLIMLLAFPIALASYIFISHQVRPTEGNVLVLTGRRNVGADGEAREFRVIRAGQALRTPILEAATSMSIRPFPVPISISAYAINSEQLRLRGSAQVRVDVEEIENAVDRFLGREEAELAQVAAETIEGHIRGVVADMSKAELDDDLALAGRIIEESRMDLASLGLHLDSLIVVAKTGPVPRGRSDVP